MELLTIFKVLYRKVWYLIGLPVLAVILTFLLTSDFKKLYRSTAQLSTGFTISQEVNITSERFSPYDSEVKFNNLIETMKSSRVLSLLSYNLIIHDLEVDGKSKFTKLNIEDEEDIAFLNSIDKGKLIGLYHQKLDSMLILNTLIPEEKEAQKLMELYEYDFETLKENINVGRVKSTDYVSIDAYTENPLLSAYMVNTLCKELLRFNVRLVNTRKSNTVETFAKLVQEKRKELDLATDNLQKFKRYNSMVNFEMERENKISRISELELDLAEENKKHRAISLQLRDVKRRLSGVNDLERITNQDVVEIRREINEMNERYRNSGYVDKNLKDSLVILRDIQQRYIRIVSQENEVTSYEQLQATKRELEVDLQIAEQNIKALEENISNANVDVGGFASKEARIDALEREVDLASEDYKAAQEKYSQALNVSMASGDSINQILLGLPATEPEPSKRIIISGISGMSTFVLIVLTIVLVEFLDSSIKNSKNFTTLVDLKLVGLLNNIDLKKADIYTIFNPEFNAKHKARLIFRDQLRKLRYFIISSRKKTILVTSMKNAEGKSNLIQALSVSISQSQMKVLIVDTNFTNNTLTKVLEGGDQLESTIGAKGVLKADMIKKTKLPKVDIIGCKGGDYSPLEIMFSRTIQKIY
ncbi:hypothetical protein [Reichenbachiella ulvae]|uniref:Uncharacterized protein n=1 Tax=Reichenbachiella ulvae TaxID=2980104 RepID=A0ABT3D0J8_9BACT|nr:hypothetical protein [Reichenbachiella ulvae]MCV9389470.1 hypothetical protein [Reichenbachiella ulvae]